MLPALALYFRNQSWTGGGQPKGRIRPSRGAEMVIESSPPSQADAYQGETAHGPQHHDITTQWHHDVKCLKSRASPVPTGGAWGFCCRLPSRHQKPCASPAPAGGAGFLLLPADQAAAEAPGTLGWNQGGAGLQTFFLSLLPMGKPRQWWWGKWLFGPSNGKPIGGVKGTPPGRNCVLHRLQYRLGRGAGGAEGNWRPPENGTQGFCHPTPHPRHITAPRLWCPTWSS